MAITNGNPNIRRSSANLETLEAAFENPGVLEQILDAKLDYLNFDIDPAANPVVQPEIAQSWKICKDSLISPSSTNLGQKVSDRCYLQIRDNNQPLIKATQPLFGMIDELAIDSDYLFELLDTEGVTLLQQGNLNIHQFSGEKYSLNEANAGTNAHTLCMRHQKPYILIGPEHYSFALQHLVAFAAPITKSDDTVAGALLLTTTIDLHSTSLAYKQLLLHSAGLVESIASAAEFQLKLDESHIQLASIQAQNDEIVQASQLLESISLNLLGTTHEEIMIVNSDGFIHQVSPGIGHLLGLPPDELVGKSLESCIGQSLPSNTTANSHKSVLEFVDKTGIPYEIRVIPLISDNKTEGYILKFSKKQTLRIGTSRGAVGDVASITFNNILGNSEQIQQAKHLAQRYADSEENILIIGESGTGKEYFAQAIHNFSRPGKPFMSINCAAIPPRLIESELFGYESGSFTGADKGGKPGKIELSDNGTLFLDEIGDMPLELQATLLRVLENKRVMRLGGKNYKQVNFRVIAATNKDLIAMTHEQTFREDLFYRISVLSFRLPPLRERGEDALFFAKYYLNECQLKAGKTVRKLSSQASDFIKSYSWPGNVRQLRNAMFSAYYACETGVISLEDIPLYLTDKAASPNCDPIAAACSTKLADSQPTDGTYTSNNTSLYSDSDTALIVPSVHTTDDKPEAGQTVFPTLSLEQLEEMAIDQAIQQANGSIPEAASLLGISKATLYRRINKANGV